MRFGTEIRIRQTEAGFAADRNASGDAARLLARGRRPAPPRHRLRRAHRSVEHSRLSGTLPDLPRPRGHRSRSARGGTHQPDRPAIRSLREGNGGGGRLGRRDNARAAHRRHARPLRVVGQVRDGHSHRLAASDRRRAGRRGRARRRRADGMVEACAEFQRHRLLASAPRGLHQSGRVRAGDRAAHRAQRVSRRDGATDDLAFRGRNGPARRGVGVVRGSERAVGPRRRRGRGRAGAGTRRARSTVLRVAGSERERIVARAARMAPRARPREGGRSRQARVRVGLRGNDLQGLDR